MTESLDGAPLVFTHYGNTDYLSRTLAAARLTNPSKRLVLIGDAANRQTALAAGWEHVLLDNYESALRTEFLSVFKVIKGKQHISPPGDRNWVQYVLDRWFILTAFAQTEKLGSFWHFDSDVMIATGLYPFEKTLAKKGSITRNNAAVNASTDSWPPKLRKTSVDTSSRSSAIRNGWHGGRNGSMKSIRHLH